MSLRTVTDTVLRGDGSPFANERVTFYRRRGGSSVVSTYPPSPVSVETDDDGAYSASLTPNTEMMTPNTWLAIYPGQDAIEFTLFPGAPISMAEIRAAGLIKTWSTPDLTVAMEAYRATWDANLTNEATTRSTADTTLQTNITTEASSRAAADTVIQTQITNGAGGYSTLAARMTGIDTLPGAMRLAAAPLAGATSISLRTAPEASGSGKQWAIIDPFTSECEIRPVTLSGTTATIAALTYAHAADDAVLWTTNPEFNPVLFGAVCNGTTIHTTALQRTITAAIAGSKQVVIPGPLAIDATINIQDCAGLTIRGVGGGATGSEGAIINWKGNTTTPAFLVEDTRELVMSRIVIRAGSSFPLAEGIRSQNGAASGSPTANTFDHVMIDGTAGYVGKGWRYAVGVGGDANNDHSTFNACEVLNYGTGGGIFTNPTAWSFEHPQSKAHVFYNCQAIGIAGQAKYGVSTALNGSTGGSFYWHGGAISRCSEAAFYLGTPNDAIHVSDMQMENNARMVITDGPGGASWPITFEGIRYDSAGEHDADLRIINHQYPGPLSIKRCQFYGTDGVDFYLRLNVSVDYGFLTVEDCTIQTSLSNPFTYPATARVNLSHNHRLTGGVYTALPDVLTSTSARKVWIPAVDFDAGTGTPTLATIGGSGSSRRVFSLTDSAQRDVFTTVLLPPDFASGNVTVKVVWTGATNPGANENVYWQILMGSYADGESVTTTDTSNAVAAAVPATALLRATTTLTTAGLAVAGDVLGIEVIRRGDVGASDTYGGTVYMLGVILEYAANVVQ